jgi:hypothetical protein
MICFLPSHALSDVELRYFAKAAQIENFRGVYMRNTLPRNPRTNEKAIINLDSMEGEGTHWVCYSKKKNIVCYYNSFGNIPPPTEFTNYMKNCIIDMNRDCEQQEDSVICGHLCILYLCN